MNLQYNFLFISLIIMSFILWKTWENDKRQIIKFEETIKENKNSNEKNKIFNDLNLKKENFISIKNDVIEIKINENNGNIYEANLLNYYKNLNSKKPLKILETKRNFLYNAENGILEIKNFKLPLSYNENIFRIKRNKNEKFFTFQNPKQDEIHIPLTFKLKNKDIIYKKIYILKKGSYNIKIKNYVTNKENNIVQIAFFGQLKQTAFQKNLNNLDNQESSIKYSDRGISFSTDKINYKKLNIKNIKKNQIQAITKNGWIAMLQQYFTSAWILPKNDISTIYTSKENEEIKTIGFKTSPINLIPKQEISKEFNLWIGPKLQSEMKQIAPYLDLTVDYGFLWFISQPLFKILKFINNFIKNWGFSIITLTLALKLLLYPLTKTQYTSITKMKILQPKIATIKEKNKNNKQLMNQEIMKLYQSENINPFSGCLPIIIQMPIFLALYYMLLYSVELRHAPFVFWIKDLSSKDPLYILPILMGCTMFFMQEDSKKSKNDNPMKKQLVLYTPIFFTLFFLWLPSGLVLYYIINNLITIIQQKIIYKQINKKNIY